MQCHSCGYAYAPYPFGSVYPDEEGICGSCGKRADLRPLVEAVEGLSDKLEGLARDLELSGGTPGTIGWLREYAHKVRATS